MLLFVKNLVVLNKKYNVSVTRKKYKRNISHISKWSLREHKRIMHISLFQWPKYNFSLVKAIQAMFYIYECFCFTDLWFWSCTFRRASWECNYDTRGEEQFNSPCDKLNCLKWLKLGIHSSLSTIAIFGTGETW